MAVDNDNSRPDDANRTKLDSYPSWLDKYVYYDVNGIPNFGHQFFEKLDQHKNAKIIAAIQNLSSEVKTCLHIEPPKKSIKLTNSPDRDATDPQSSQPGSTSGKA